MVLWGGLRAQAQLGHPTRARFVTAGQQLAVGVARGFGAFLALPTLGLAQALAPVLAGGLEQPLAGVLLCAAEAAVQAGLQHHGQAPCARRALAAAVGRWGLAQAPGQDLCVHLGRRFIALDVRQHPDSLNFGLGVKVCAFVQHAIAVHPGARDHPGRAVDGGFQQGLADGLQLPLVFLRRGCCCGD